MKHTYQVSGMTLTCCQTKVQDLLLKVPGVKKVTIDLSKGAAEITMNAYVTIDALRIALWDYPIYKLTEPATSVSIPTKSINDENKSWFTNYKAFSHLFRYSAGIAGLVATLKRRYKSLPAIT